MEEVETSPSLSNNQTCVNEQITVLLFFPQLGYIVYNLLTWKSRYLLKFIVTIPLFVSYVKKEQRICQ